MDGDEAFLKHITNFQFKIQGFSNLPSSRNSSAILTIFKLDLKYLLG
jgi:hypothetical protein